MEGQALAGADDGGEPVIEEPPDGEEPDGPSLRELRQRVRQQELLFHLAVQALKGTPFPELLHLTARPVRRPGPARRILQGARSTGRPRTGF